MSSSAEVLAVLFDTSTVFLPTSGRTVEVKKVTLRTMKPVLDLVGRALADLKLAPKAGGDLASFVPTIDMTDPATIVKLISTYYEDLLDIVVAHTTLSKDEIQDLDLDDSVLVVQAVLVLNKDFFMTKVLPSLRVLAPEEG